jgi:hypothetical protein
MSSKVNTKKTIETAKRADKCQFSVSNNNESSKKTTKLDNNVKKEKPRVPIKLTSSKYFDFNSTNLEKNGQH